MKKKITKTIEQLLAEKTNKTLKLALKNVAFKSNGKIAVGVKFPSLKQVDSDEPISEAECMELLKIELDLLGSSDEITILPPKTVKPVNAKYGYVSGKNPTFQTNIFTYLCLIRYSMKHTELSTTAKECLIIMFAMSKHKFMPSDFDDYKSGLALLIKEIDSTIYHGMPLKDVKTTRSELSSELSRLNTKYKDQKIKKSTFNALSTGSVLRPYNETHIFIRNTATFNHIKNSSNLCGLTTGRSDNSNNCDIILIPKSLSDKTIQTKFQDIKDISSIQTKQFQHYLMFATSLEDNEGKIICISAKESLSQGGSYTPTIGKLVDEYLLSSVEQNNKIADIRLELIDLLRNNYHFVGHYDGFTKTDNYINKLSSLTTILAIVQDQKANGTKYLNYVLSNAKAYFTSHIILKGNEAGDKDKVEMMPWNAANIIRILEDTIEVSDNNKCQSTYLSFYALVNNKREFYKFAARTPNKDYPHITVLSLIKA